MFFYLKKQPKKEEETDDNIFETNGNVGTADTKKRKFGIERNKENQDS